MPRSNGRRAGQSPIPITTNLDLRLSAIRRDHADRTARMRQTRPSISSVPIGRRPLIHGESYLLDIGKCDVECPHCGALHWMQELSTKGTQRHPSFTTCCGDGAIQLPPLHDASPYLQHLLSETDQDTSSTLDLADIYRAFDSVRTSAITTTPSPSHLSGSMSINPLRDNKVFIPSVSVVSYYIVSGL